MTITHPGLPAEVRGTFAGLGHPAMLEHFRDLGVTGLLLLPVASFATERQVEMRGLSEYWGYRTVAPFAPHAGYSATGDPAREFRSMVKSLHSAGIEVLLDLPVAFTAEGDHLGPTFSLRGIDNVSYYRLNDASPSRYIDLTGAGNAINVRSPMASQMILDVLRFWVTEMHVDGFRLPKAVVLGREEEDFSPLAALLNLITNDPVFGDTKIIAEPWDFGPSGEQTGRFPPRWCEMNDSFRDSVRRFWLVPQMIDTAAFASRFLGSPDLYQAAGRGPVASVNRVASHDGFPLADLVAYDQPHNEANVGYVAPAPENSWNCGVEGPTDDPQVLAVRERMRRSLLLTVVLAQGVPMLSHGDEMGRTQRGNSHADCQDNELTWIDWGHVDEAMLAFTRAVIDIRSANAVFQRRQFLTGRPVRGGDEVPDLAWFGPEGAVLDETDLPEVDKTMTLFLNGDGIRERSARAERVGGVSMLLLFNRDAVPHDLVLPSTAYAPGWSRVLDTAGEQVDDGEILAAGASVSLPSYSVAVLQADYQIG